MEQMIVRAAEILNVSEDDLRQAFQNAMNANMPQPPSGSGQQPPPQGEPPQMSGETPQQPPQPPEGQTPGMPPGQPSGQGPGFDMQQIYAEIAETLGISEVDVAAAFEQAQLELAQ
jgi:hypothetical protein